MAVSAIPGKKEQDVSLTEEFDYIQEHLKYIGGSPMLPNYNKYHELHRSIRRSIANLHSGEEQRDLVHRGGYLSLITQFLEHPENGTLTDDAAFKALRIYHSGIENRVYQKSISAQADFIRGQVLA